MVQLLHSYMTTGKTIALTRWTFVGKVMSLLFNTLSRSAIAFLPRSKCLLILWLQSPSTVIVEPKKIKSGIVFTSFPSICRSLAKFALLTYRSQHRFAAMPRSACQDLLLASVGHSFVTLGLLELDLPSFLLASSYTIANYKLKTWWPFCPLSPNFELMINIVLINTFCKRICAWVCLILIS